jgi:excinuclease ABC subunit B
MQRAIEETERRRKLQQEYNAEHGITPETIRKAIHRGIESEAAAHARANAAVGRTDEVQYVTEEFLTELEEEMLAAAKDLEFERAAALRDRIERMRNNMGEPVESVKESPGGRRGRGRGRVPRPKRNA